MVVVVVVLVAAVVARMEGMRFVLDPDIDCGHRLAQLQSVLFLPWTNPE